MLQGVVIIRAAVRKLPDTDLRRSEWQQLLQFRQQVLIAAYDTTVHNVECLVRQVGLLRTADSRVARYLVDKGCVVRAGGATYRHHRRNLIDRNLHSQSGLNNTGLPLQLEMVDHLGEFRFYAAQTSNVILSILNGIDRMDLGEELLRLTGHTKVAIGSNIVVVDER